jgi:Tfp pilus assembly protein PilO
MDISLKLSQILKRKDLPIHLIIIILGLVCSNYLFQKQQNKIKALNSAVALEQEKLKLAEEVAELDSKLVKISGPYLKKTTSFSPQGLNELVSKCGIRIISIAQENKQEGEQYQINSYKLSLEAAYPDLSKFIGLLESLPDLVELKDLSIQRTQQENILTINITVSITFIK